MNIKSSMITAAAAAVLALSLTSAAHAKILIVGHDEAYVPVTETKVADAYEEPACKFVKVKIVKLQYGRKIVTFKTKKVCE